MYNADPKLVQRIQRHVQRVLIVDPHPAAARLISDLMKDCGARDVIIAPEAKKAWEVAEAFDPQLLFVEFRGPEFRGVDFVRDLRRSGLDCRQAPVVMLSADATLENIKAARDSGVHEFLVKPFTARDLFRRVENVALRSRLWIEAKMYVGPDRRRFNSAEKGYGGPKKRRSDSPRPIEEARSALDLADAAIRTQLDLMDESPQTALRHMLEQSAELQGMAYHFANPDLTTAVTLFQKYLLNAFERGSLSRKRVEHHLNAMKALTGEEKLQPEARKQLLSELAAAAA